MQFRCYVLVLPIFLSGCNRDAAPGAGPNTGDAATVGSDDGGNVPSNAQIVFMSPIKNQTLAARGFEIVTMSLDGSNRHQLTDNDRLEFLPHFSPDGTRLLYTTYLTGSYGQPSATTDVAILDIATGVETNITNTGKDGYPVWSPDGKRIAFLDIGANGPASLWVMNADGSERRRVIEPKGPPDEMTFGDIGWSSQDWIMFVVAANTGGCFKVRIDKIRPDGSGRTQVTDGGPSCTPMGMEQSGDADPGFSADGKTIYSSRGFPTSPTGAPDGGGPLLITERKLYAFSSDAWFAGKPERDLSLASEPSCIEGVPKGSPDGKRVLLFRACFDRPDAKGGVYVSDSAGTYRALVADGFGPDWNPIAR